MARFDVHESRVGLLLDCQSDTLRHLSTRFVVPLMSPEQAPLPARHLNPTFEVDAQEVVMVTQFASSVFARDLGRRVGTLDHEHGRIMAALDMLISGY